MSEDESKSEMEKETTLKMGAEIRCFGILVDGWRLPLAQA